MKKHLLILSSLMMLCVLSISAQKRNKDVKNPFTNPPSFELKAKGGVKAVKSGAAENPEAIYYLRGVNNDTINAEFFTYETGTAIVSEKIGKRYASGDFIDTVKIAYTYNPAGSILTETHSVKNNDSWVFSYRSVTTYNTANKILTVMESEFISGSWLNYYKTEFVYDSNGNLESEEYSSFDGNSWELEEGYRSVHTYTNSNKIETITYSEYSGTYEPVSKETYTYDTDDYLIEIVTEEHDGSNWENISKIEFVNNASGISTTQISYEWDDVNTAWLGTEKYLSIQWKAPAEGKRITALFDVVFSQNEFIGTTYQIWDETLNSGSGGWKDSLQMSFTYNSANKPLINLIKFPVSFGGLVTWLDVLRVKNTYDSKGNLSEFLVEQSAGGFSWTVLFGFKSNYVYDTKDNLETINYETYQNGTWSSSGIDRYIYSYTFLSTPKRSMNNAFKMYPNPSKDFVTIEFDADKQTVITVFDITGQKVMSKSASLNATQEVINVSELNNGVYFLQINNGKGTNTRKFIKN
jgi:hypothetical protein